MNPVIEVSCGEYGDNIKNLVNAIRNGKSDVREGFIFSEKKQLNNEIGKDVETLPLNQSNIAKDKNDVNCIEEKFRDDKSNQKNNSNMMNTYSTNDIKQSKIFFHEI